MRKIKIHICCGKIPTEVLHPVDFSHKLKKLMCPVCLVSNPNGWSKNKAKRAQLWNMLFHSKED